MRAREIRDHLRRQPFHPFRLHLSDGTRYDVQHPELLLVTQRELCLALGASGSAVPTRAAYIDPLHVVQVELLEVGEAG